MKSQLRKLQGHTVNKIKSINYCNHKLFPIVFRYE